MTTNEARNKIVLLVRQLSPGIPTHTEIRESIDALISAVRSETLAPPVKGSCYECGGVGCDDCDGTGDAGAQVLKLKNRLHLAEFKISETLAPATHGQSEHLAEAEREFRESTTMKVCIWREHRDVIVVELHRLRAALSTADAELADVKGKYQFMVDRACEEHLDGYRELAAKVCRAEEERDDARAENAELRRLCDDARELIRDLIPDEMDPEERASLREFMKDLEAAARRAGK